jgi:hypothetical protein
MNAVNILLTKSQPLTGRQSDARPHWRQDAHSPGRLHDAKVWLTVLVATFPDV